MLSDPQCVRGSDPSCPARAFDPEQRRPLQPPPITEISTVRCWSMDGTTADEVTARRGESSNESAVRSTEPGEVVAAGSAVCRSGNGERRVVGDDTTFGWVNLVGITRRRCRCRLTAPGSASRGWREIPWVLVSGLGQAPRGARTDESWNATPGLMVDREK